MAFANPILLMVPFVTVIQAGLGPIVTSPLLTLARDTSVNMESVCLLMRSPIVASAKMVIKGPCATRKWNYTTRARVWNVFMVSARSQMQGVGTDC